jgi:hypothetical protein
MAIESSTPVPSTHAPLPTATLKQQIHASLLTKAATKMSTPDQKAAKRARFEGAFAKIREELVGHMRGEGLPEEAVKWFENVRCSFLSFFLSSSSSDGWVCGL